MDWGPLASLTSSTYAETEGGVSDGHPSLLVTTIQGALLVCF